MSPLAAMPNPLADLAPANPAAAGGTEGHAAGGFADALQRASGGQRPDATKPGPSRKDRHASTEAKPADPPADKLASPEGASEEAVPGANAAEAGSDKATPDHDAAPGNEATSPGIPLAVPQAEPQRAGGTAPGAGPDDLPAVSSIPATRAQPAATVHDAASPDGASQGDPETSDSGHHAAPANPVTPSIVTATTAAGPATQAAIAQAAATAPPGQGGAGTGPRRPGAAATPIDRASAGTSSREPTAAGESAAGTPSPANARATPDLAAGTVPGATTTGDFREAFGLAQAGSGQGFEDMLAASPALGTESGAAVASAPGSPAATGGIRPIALPIATPVYSPAFPQALGQQLAMALRMDLGQAELILSPAELGPVRVELSLDGSSASVQFAAPNAETRQALEQSLPNLRALFAEQGLSLADTHVGPGFHRGNDERPADGSAHQRSHGQSVAAIDGAIRPTGVRVRPDALVDLFA